MSRMLSRFSNFPAFNLLTSSSYDRDVINRIVSEIKSIGRATMTTDDSAQDIQRILNHMKKYKESLHIQRVACHALSNLAMQVLPARWIIQKGGFEVIRECLQRFMEDYKLCWLASSALWNLARPPANRSLIGERGVKLMLNVLSHHHTREKVVNTAIGALSNLSLCQELKDVIATEESVVLIFDVLHHYMEEQSMSVMTSGAGLIANIAVSDEHANTLTNKGFLPLLLEILHWKSEDEITLFRNVCAALNNLITADKFLSELLSSYGIESIYQFLANNENDLFENLLENCLINVEADPTHPTTSLHLGAFHGRLDIIKRMLKDDPQQCLDLADANHMTPLDYAITQNRVRVAEFLCLCGAAPLSETENVPAEMLAAMKKGEITLSNTKAMYRDTVRNALKMFPTDICDLLVDESTVYDLLEPVGLV